MRRANAVEGERESRRHHHAQGDTAIGSISFKRISPEESTIYDADGEHVGDVYAHDDILNPGARVFLISLDEDSRGWMRVQDRSHIRDVTEQRLRTHPLFT